MESEGVSLPLIHEHLMVPWNHRRKGDCCGRFQAISDGYFCKICSFFVHKSCSEFSEYIEHTSHPGHILKLQIDPDHGCRLCGRSCGNLFYSCELCDFDIDLYCTKYPPPKDIDIPAKHRHKLTLYKGLLDFRCSAKCGKYGRDEYPYKCHECDLTFHVDCVWHPPVDEHALEYTTIDVGNRVLLPFFHEHFMAPRNDMVKGDCCGGFSSITDGFYCESCDFFVHKKCTECSELIVHPSHSNHYLHLRKNPKNQCCNLCGKKIVNLFYDCAGCNFNIDLYCVTSPPPNVIDISATHHHKLILLKKRMYFDCHAKCGKRGEEEYAYKCRECELTFHADCVWHPPEVLPSEVNHPYHSFHPLKLLTGRPPKYCDGICRLCEKNIGSHFYHCSLCNFTVDLRCMLNPPPQYLLDLKVHDHQLTLLPRLDSFTCNACGLKGDGSRYVCFQCGFTIHKECLGLPRLININRHGHRVARTSVLGVVDSVCGVCRKKVDWIYGGYSCKRCPDYVVHSKCATQKNVWNGKELEGIPEEIEDIEPYVRIDENTIQHFSHEEHHLRMHVNGVVSEENKRCSACNHPICLQPFYSCIVCEFFLHQNCAELPKKKWHVLHNEKLTLLPSKARMGFQCDACLRVSNGFAYKHGKMELDVRCSSISEPFVHPSHPQHPLYYIPRDKKEICNGCNQEESHVLRCIEDGCEFVLGFKCATLPQVVKHRVDDHPLSLCYGEKAIGKCWCDICEKESDTNKWFYTCKDHRASLHTECVVGDFVGLMPGSTIQIKDFSAEVLLNDSVSRPLCRNCESHCIYPIILKEPGTSCIYLCSFGCG